MSHQRQFFNYLAKRLKVENYEDWYNVGYTDILPLGARGLLDRYDGSLSKALVTIYPEYGIMVIYLCTIDSSLI
jgi:hypothetical protein